MPIDLYWINGPWLGRLAILPRPRADDWLEDDVRSWHYAGVDAVLSLLSKEEATELGVIGEDAYCRANGISFHSLEIADGGVPDSSDVFSQRLAELAGLLTEERNVAIHSRNGRGRAALIAIGLLVESGLDLDAAMRRVAAARGCHVPETPEQRSWIQRFAESLATQVSTSW